MSVAVPESNGAGDRSATDISSLAEALPGVIPPLLWDINAPMLDDALRRVHRGPEHTRGLWAIRQVEGRAALDTERLRQAPGPRRLRMTKARRETEIVTTSARELADLGIDVMEASDSAIGAYRAHVRDLAWRATAHQVAAAWHAQRAYRSLERLLERWLPKDHARAWTQQICVVPGARPPETASRSIYGGPTWAEDRVAPLGPGDGPNPLDDLVAALAVAPEWRAQRWLGGQLIDLRLRSIRRMARRARALMSWREELKAAVLTLGGEERRGIFELSRRLVERGVLRRAADAELLTDRELTSAITGSAAPAALAARRRRLESARAAAQPTRRLDPSSERLEPLHGLPASPGVLVGTARHLSSPGDDGLGHGEIIVAISTDASWNHLLAVAGGVVSELGSPLSHAAITARELGIPAVVGVVAATEHIRSGDIVEIDGSAGTVHRRPPVQPVARLQIVFPLVMGAGLMASLVSIGTDTVLGLLPADDTRWAARRARAVHHLVSKAAGTVGRVAPHLEPRRQLRPRSQFLAGAAVLGASAIALAMLGLDAAASSDFVEARGWAQAWAIAMSIILGLPALAALGIALVHRHLPHRLRAFMATTTLGRLRPPPPKGES